MQHGKEWQKWIKSGEKQSRKLNRRNWTAWFLFASRFVVLMLLWYLCWRQRQSCQTQWNVWTRRGYPSPGVRWLAAFSCPCLAYRARQWAQKSHQESRVNQTTAPVLQLLKRMRFTVLTAHVFNKTLSQRINTCFHLFCRRAMTSRDAPDAVRDKRHLVSHKSNWISSFNCDGILL